MFPRDVIETALAREMENRIEAAYRRSDALEKRRVLMQQWADYCTAALPAEGNVVSLAVRKAG